VAAPEWTVDGATDDVTFAAGDAPRCTYDAVEKITKVQYSEDLHIGFHCTHDTGAGASPTSCTCTTVTADDEHHHPTAEDANCMQFESSDAARTLQTVSDSDTNCAPPAGPGPNDVTDRTPIALWTQPGSGNGDQRSYMSFTRVNGGSAHSRENPGTNADKWLLKKCLAGAACGVTSLNDASEWTPAGAHPTTGEPSIIRYGDIVAVLPARGDYTVRHNARQGPMPDNWLQDEDASLNCDYECRYRLYSGGTQSKPGPTQYPPESTDQLMKVVSMDGSKAVGDKLQYDGNFGLELVDSNGLAFGNDYLSCQGHRTICRRTVKNGQGMEGMTFTAKSALTQNCIDGFRFVGSYDGFCTGTGVTTAWDWEENAFFPPTGKDDLTGMQTWCANQPECLGYGQHYQYDRIYKATTVGGHLDCPSPEGVMGYEFLYGAGYNQCAPWHESTNGCYVKFPCDSFHPYEYEGTGSE
jgi:hypothetical protein